MKERETLNEFKPGDLFIYRNGDRYEIGKVKGIKDDTHCWYHEGETAASTSVDVMHKIMNDFCIKKTSLGGVAEEVK
jgi:hypothetical protein